jgi:hypothetical protein
MPVKKKTAKKAAKKTYSSAKKKDRSGTEKGYD